MNHIKILLFISALFPDSNSFTQTDVYKLHFGLSGGISTPIHISRVK